MKTRVVLQDAIKTMRVQLSMQRRDLTSLEFSLDPDIFLNDCFIDGKPYEINLFSSLKDGRRVYKLPVFLSSLELHYDAKLNRDKEGRLILNDHSGWLPVWPESPMIREFEIHYPESDLYISNYQAQSLPTSERDYVVHLVGQGWFQLIIGPFIRRKNFSHEYYLIHNLDIELFDKFIRVTKHQLESTWGKPEAWIDRFLEGNGDLSEGMVMSVSRPELLTFQKMPGVLSRLVERAYPVEFGEYFRLFRWPFYDYLAWRALTAVMSQSEQLKLLPASRTGHGPLVEQSELSDEGILFFYDLEQTVGRQTFETLIKELMLHHKSIPLSLVHFINQFGRDEKTRQMLEHWLFMGRE